MKRRFLVAAHAIRGDGADAFLNSVIELEPDEHMNATAIDQIEKLLTEQHEAKIVTVLNFTQLEGAAPRYALHDELRNDWMAANTYCTNNGIEGDDNAIRLLIADHKRVEAQRNHLQGLLKKAMTGLIEVSNALDVDSARAHAESIHASVRTVAVALNLDEAGTVAPKHPMTPNYIEYETEG